MTVQKEYIIQVLDAESNDSFITFYLQQQKSMLKSDGWRVVKCSKENCAGN